MNEPPGDIGPSRVQGCLYAAVGMFVVLLVILLVLAFLRFEEFTGEDAPPISSVEAPALVPRAHPAHFPASVGAAPSYRFS